MDKSDCIEIIKLFSALESWSVSCGKGIPDYLQENLWAIMDKLTQEVLSSGERLPPYTTYETYIQWSVVSGHTQESESKPPNIRMKFDIATGKLIGAKVIE